MRHVTILLKNHNNDFYLTEIKISEDLNTLEFVSKGRHLASVKAILIGLDDFEYKEIENLDADGNENGYKYILQYDKPYTSLEKRLGDFGDIFYLLTHRYQIILEMNKTAHTILKTILFAMKKFKTLFFDLCNDNPINISNLPDLSYIENLAFDNSKEVSVNIESNFGFLHSASENPIDVIHYMSHFIDKNKYQEILDKTNLLFNKLTTVNGFDITGDSKLINPNEEEIEQSFIATRDGNSSPTRKEIHEELKYNKITKIYLETLSAVENSPLFPYLNTTVDNHSLLSIKNHYVLLLTSTIAHFFSNADFKNARQTLEKMKLWIDTESYHKECFQFFEMQFMHILGQENKTVTSAFMRALPNYISEQHQIPMEHVTSEIFQNILARAAGQWNPSNISSKNNIIIAQQLSLAFLKYLEETLSQSTIELSEIKTENIKNILKEHCNSSKTANTALSETRDILKNENESNSNSNDNNSTNETLEELLLLADAIHSFNQNINNNTQLSTNPHASFSNTNANSNSNSNSNENGKEEVNDDEDDSFSYGG